MTPLLKPIFRGLYQGDDGASGDPLRRREARLMTTKPSSSPALKKSGPSRKFSTVLGRRRGASMPRSGLDARLVTTGGAIDARIA